MQFIYSEEDDDALESMIHRAAARGDVQTVSRLLDEDPEELRRRNGIDNEPLHTACDAKKPEVVRLLLERGADANARGDYGQTPLHWAVRDGGPEAVKIIEMLVEAGADVTLKDESLEENALDWALREFKDELEPAIQLLRKKGASLGLAGAMILGDKDMVRLLLSERDEPLSVQLVQHIYAISKDCGQKEITKLIGKWLKCNAKNE